MENSMGSCNEIISSSRWVFLIFFYIWTKFFNITKKNYNLIKIISKVNLIGVSSKKKWKMKGKGKIYLKWKFCVWMWCVLQGISIFSFFYIKHKWNRDCNSPHSSLIESKCTTTFNYIVNRVEIFFTEYFYSSLLFKFFSENWF